MPHRRGLKFNSLELFFATRTSENTWHVRNSTCVFHTIPIKFHKRTKNVHLKQDWAINKFYESWCCTYHVKIILIQFIFYFAFSIQYNLTISHLAKILKVNLDWVRIKFCSSMDIKWLLFRIRSKLFSPAYKLSFIANQNFAIASSQVIPQHDGYRCAFSTVNGIKISMLSRFYTKWDFEHAIVARYIVFLNITYDGFSYLDGTVGHRTFIEFILSLAVLWFSISHCEQFFWETCRFWKNPVQYSIRIIHQSFRLVHA